MKKVFRIVQFFSNVALFVFALLASFVLVKNFVWSSPKPESVNVEQTSLSNSAKPSNRLPPESIVGKTVSLDTMNWKDNKSTLILYLSTTCRFCRESVPFYQQLLKQNQNNRVRIIAVLPQPVNESREYLGSNDLIVDRIFSDSLRSIGVNATPTLILVDEQG